MKKIIRFLSERMVKILNAVLMLFSVCAIILEVNVLTRAQEIAPQPPAQNETASQEDILSEEDLKCVQSMKEFMVAKQIELGEFMTTHFRSKKPASELIPDAVERLRQYKADVRAQLENFMPKDRALAQTAVSERPACEKAVIEDLAITKELVRQHILENAYAKKSSRLLDKYKEINSRLEKLNFTIAQFYGYFGAFAQRLPCYAKKCVGR